MASTFWQDRHVLITGASSGIGRELAIQLAERGARLGLMARRADVLAELADRLRQRGARCAFAAVDVTDLAGVRDAVRRLQAELGPCDVMIANAGIHRDTPGWRFDAADVAAVMQTNVLGVANALDAVLPTMIERRAGRIAAVSSLAGIIGLPFVAAYSASKAAVERLIESLRVDLKQYSIAATAILPGYIQTPMLENVDRGRQFNIMPVEQAAGRILRAIERGQARSRFPGMAGFFLRLLRALPFRFYERVTQRIIRRERDRDGSVVTGAAHPESDSG